MHSPANSPTELPRLVLHVMNAAGGGAALSTLGLIRELREAHGIEHAIICHDAGSKAEFDALRDAVNGRLVVRPLYWWNKKSRATWWKRPILEALQLWATGWRRASIRAVADAAKVFGADLIHSNTFTTIEGGFAARQLRLPHVWHLREMVGAGQPFRFPLEGPKLGRWLVGMASLVVANSQASAACVADWLPAERLAVVVNGIDVGEFSPRTDYDHAPPIVLGMVANLTSPVKRHDWFIDAAARLPRELGAEFRLYGHDPTRSGTVRGNAYTAALLDAIDRHGLRERVKFMGHQSPTEVMRALDVLVHPTGQESFGRIAVEAMAAGLAVVGANQGGVAEIVRDGETGFAITPGDCAAMARAMETLVRDANLRQTLGQRGRQIAEKEYSLTRSAAKIADCYRTAMQRPLGS